MARYKKRTDGRYSTSVTINGKRQSVYAKSSKELEQKVAEIKYGNPLESTITNDITFKDYAEKWLKIISAGKSDATVREYNFYLNKYLIPNFGYKKLKNITRLDIQILQAELLKDNHFELAHKCIRYMKAICNDAILNNSLLVNPAMNIKEPKLVHKENIPLTEEQDKLLLESKHKYAPFFRILRYTGMRREEICALEVNDVDIKNKRIRINKAVSLAKNRPILKSTKNRKQRIIPILDIIYEDLKNQVELCNTNNYKYLFVQEKNTKSMLSQGSIVFMVKKIRENLGFHLNCHQLRHTFCTMLYNAHVGIKEAQNLMGHSSSKMVLDIYTHLDNIYSTVTDELNNFLTPSSEKSSQKSSQN